ncbi:MAG: nitronate monooxygenase, partial [Pseudomonadales bacterium]|nr:nitronate monooxygenase [Pseudomonadales bacterium]
MFCAATRWRDKMKLHSPVCDIFQIEYPIVLAGMGGASTPALAAAVSNAGGLGVLGAAACQPDQLREWIRETRSLTDKPFGVDTLLPASVRRAAQTAEGGEKSDPMEVLKGHMAFAKSFMDKEDLTDPYAERRRENSGNNLPVFSKEFFDAQMQVIIEEKVPVYAAGLGNPGPWMDRLHSNGTKVMAVIGKVKHAQQVVDSGIDMIV